MTPMINSVSKTADVLKYHLVSTRNRRVSMRMPAEETDDFPCW